MRNLRISLATITSLLLCIGIVMIFSSSSVYALRELGDSSYFLKRHLAFLCIGFVLALMVMTLDYRDFQKYAKPFLLVSVFLLILVLIPGIGREISGARRWFRLWHISFQPSEVTKLAIIFYMADFLARKQNKIRDLKEGFIPPMLVLAAVYLLIVKQPDLGTALSIAVIVFIMMFIAGMSWLHLVTVLLLSLPAIYLLIVRVPYRLARIMSFLYPMKDVRGIGFQLHQSFIALGSGGFMGVGLGKSMQKLFYLPAAYTDFIFSIIGEEFGLFGAVIVVMLFALFVWQGARIAKRTEEKFGYFLSVGIVAMIGLQAVVNIGVSIGILPTKGLPLPFISYGGSSLIVNMVAVGLLLNISRIQEL